jgi:hypothetical protein
MLHLPSEIERKLIAIWEDVLDVRPVHVHKGFLDLAETPSQPLKSDRQVVNHFS